MPNHVASYLIVTGPVADVRRFVSAVDKSNPDLPVDDGVGGKSFDFNGVVPMPEELRGTTSPARIQTQAEIDKQWADWREAKAKKQDSGPMGIHSFDSDRPFGLGITQEASNALIAKYGANNWYDWAHNNWGTKWGAYDSSDWDVTEGEEGNATAAIYYNTAWSPATPFFERASALFPTLTFDTQYADEGGGFVCETSYENGEVTEDHEYAWDSNGGVAVREVVGYGPMEDEDLDAAAEDEDAAVVDAKQ